MCLIFFPFLNFRFRRLISQEDLIVQDGLVKCDRSSFLFGGSVHGIRLCGWCLDLCRFDMWFFELGLIRRHIVTLYFDFRVQFHIQEKSNLMLLVAHAKGGIFFSL